MIPCKTKSYTITPKKIRPVAYQTNYKQNIRQLQKGLTHRLTRSRKSNHHSETQQNNLRLYALLTMLTQSW